MATPDPPLAMVPKEYVRQQLKSMGINEISEEELEAYTRDFSRLIQEHIDHDSTSTSDMSSLSEAGRLQPMSTISSNLSSTEQTPINIHHPPPPGSAVFKTFPGNKENRVQLLSPSPSPNSILLSPNRNLSMVSNEATKVRIDGRRVLKRKVLRKCNGESRVFDESLNSSALKDEEVSKQLSDLSLTSITSSEGSVKGDYETQRRPHSCKSFIRPPLVHPHLRGLKKCDPVQRYHEFHKLWEAQKPPGEKNRSRLRWHIREQLLQQDVPYYQPTRRTPKVNQFVVPTDKKRTSLRWEVRHQLAN